MNFNPTLTLGPKIKSKYLSGLKVKAKTIKFLEENIRKNLHDLEAGRDVFRHKKH